MENQDNTNTGKRTTPGRAAKTNNKRKLSSEDSQAVVHKPEKSAKMSLTLEQLRDELAKSEERTATKIDKAIQSLSVRVDDNANLIRAEREERRRDMQDFRDQLNMINNNSRDAVARSVPGLRPRPTNGFLSRDEDQYSKLQRSRRSLLMYPVKGDSPGAIMAELQTFLLTQLQIPRGEIERSNIEVVRRFRGIRNSRARHEIIVVFSDPEIRDFVLSHAKNLAGKPDMGVRIDVPQHLLGIKKVLDEYGFVLKTEIGPNFKRNVRYDDTNETLAMDVFYPDTKKWERITYLQATEGLSVKKSLESAAVDRVRNPLLSSSSNVSGIRNNSGTGTFHLKPSQLNVGRVSAPRHAGGSSGSGSSVELSLIHI